MRLVGSSSIAYSLTINSYVYRQVQCRCGEGSSTPVKEIALGSYEVGKAVKVHPRTGTGQCEQLKHYKEETWSRRIYS